MFRNGLEPWHLVIPLVLIGIPALLIFTIAKIVKAVSARRK